MARKVAVAGRKVLRNVVREAPNRVQLGGAPGQRVAQGFCREALLGAELAVKAAVGQSCGLGQRVNADPGDPTFADEPSRLLEDALAVLGRLCFRHAHVRDPGGCGSHLTNIVTIVTYAIITLVIK
jgi:hypothetical protein